VKFIRTPERRFENLPDYPFPENYVDIDAMRMHYVDEGNENAPVVLLLHGEPSWSYLYRHMIPPIVSGGLRAIAPDLIGFGKSDKPLRKEDYSYAGHVAWMKQFIEQLNLQEITLVCQDWGSLIGLRVAAENPDHFARIVLANGFLPTGDTQPPKKFFYWRTFATYSPWFPVGRIIQSGTIATLEPEVVRAYDAPFPSRAYKAGARAFPRLVPVTPDDPATSANRAAWEVFRTWEKPFLTAFSNRDPITRGCDKIFQSEVPGCQGLPHAKIRNAGHFLQEEKGPELAQIVLDFATGGDAAPV
jgi:haloalkane dehalogenase